MKSESGNKNQVPTNIRFSRYGNGFPGGSDGKESACNAGDPGLIPGWRRSPGEKNSYPLQYSCLENPTDRGAWQTTVHGVTKSWTRLSNLHKHIQSCTFWASQVVPVLKNKNKNACQCRRCKRLGFNPLIGKIPWRRAQLPTPVFLPGKSHR